MKVEEINPLCRCFSEGAKERVAMALARVFDAGACYPLIKQAVDTAVKRSPNFKSLREIIACLSEIESDKAVKASAEKVLKLMERLRFGESGICPCCEAEVEIKDANVYEMKFLKEAFPNVRFKFS